MPQRTLVYHTGALGDFVTIEPCLRAYRRLVPGAELTYLGRHEYGCLGCAVGLFDAVLDIDRAVFASLYSPSPAPALLAQLSGYQAAVCFAGHDSPVVSALRRAGIGSIHAQPPFPAGTEHVVDYHLSLFPGITPTDDLRSPAFAGGDAVTNSSGPVAIHCGSGSARKNWPLERFREVAEQVCADGHEVLWPAGPVESMSTTPGGTGRCVRLPLIDLLRLLQNCRLYVGNDSGVTHLAAAAGCPTLALFGPSDPRVWAPRGPNVRIVRSKTGAMEGIETQKVLRAARALLRGDTGGEPGVFWHPEG